MRFRLLALLPLLLLACWEDAPSRNDVEQVPVPIGTPDREGAGFPDADEPPPGTVPEQDREEPGPTGKTPQELYEECGARLEQPEKSGECTTDADCTKAGCSTEVCTSTAQAADVMTTCEIRPCFEVLDACGCVEGTCSWSLKAPSPKPGVQLPRNGG